MENVKKKKLMTIMKLIILINFYLMNIKLKLIMPILRMLTKIKNAKYTLGVFIYLTNIYPRITIQHMSYLQKILR